LGAAEATAAVSELDNDRPRFVTRPIGEDLARAAGRLADAHHLRSGDAVHLASFEDLVARSGDDDVRFSSADARLTRVARAM
jgi:predicted nucleic acid-binding protein